MFLRTLYSSFAVWPMAHRGQITLGSIRAQAWCSTREWCGRLLRGTRAATALPRRMLGRCCPAVGQEPPPATALPRWEQLQIAWWGGAYFSSPAPPPPRSCWHHLVGGSHTPPPSCCSELNCAHTPPSNLQLLREMPENCGNCRNRSPSWQEPFAGSWTRLRRLLPREPLLSVQFSFSSVQFSSYALLSLCPEL